MRSTECHSSVILYIHFILAQSLDFIISTLSLSLFMLYSLLLIYIISGILPLMALNSLYCADVPLSNCSLTHCSVKLLNEFCFCFLVMTVNAEFVAVVAIVT